MRNLIKVTQLWLVLALLAAMLPMAQSQAQTTTSTPSPGADSPLALPSVLDEPPAGYVSDELVDEILASLTVADRVGQLFLITFQGGDTGFDSDIAELIYGYRVGGVVLSPANGNFSNEKGVDTPRQVASLVNRLQGLAYGVLLPEERALDKLPEAWPAREDMLMQEMTRVSPLNLPLFVAVEQGGDNLPETGLRRGFTPLPSQMAIGATWEPELANRVGRVVGRELAAVGVNMLFGPNLDVLEQPRSDQMGSLGVHMFGGDPFWVGQMGRAYIAGIHEGGERRVATIARSFPGTGDVDRLPDIEVPTVQRSLEELRRVTLPPFLAVTKLPANPSQGDLPASVTDGLMSGHVRYSGFQGASLGRNTPIDLAPELGAALQQEGFASWREYGGLMVTAGLGAPSIRRHYGATAEGLPFRRIALDAFIAGHDLLYLNRFASDDSWEAEKHNIQETIGFFQERYVSDPDFAQRVDVSVRRIVRLKLSLYAQGIQPAVAQAESGGALPLAAVLVGEDDLEALSEEARAAALAEVGRVARESVTLLYPDPSNAGDMASRLPQAGEKVLIFTESRLQRDCDTCTTEAAIGPEEFKDILLRLYGPEATGQLKADQIETRTFADLAELLDAELQAAAEPEMPAILPTPTPSPSAKETAVPTLPAPPEAEATEALAGAADLDKNARTTMLIDEATWILFAMLDVNPAEHPHSDVVKRFLRQRTESLASKYVAVFALNAPYFLDGTEISKLNAYYGVYSKTQPFLEGAIRALFRTYAPEGAPPVSVAGTRFASLVDRLAPDPARSFDLQILDAAGALLTTGEPAAAPPAIAVGDLIRLQAGPVIDRNGNPVGDGKTVDFVLTFEGEEAVPRVESAALRGGLASRDLLIERSGLLQVTAKAGAARNGESLALNVQGGAVPAGADTVVSETALAGAPAGALAGVEGVPAEPAGAPAEPAASAEVVAVDAPEAVGLASLIIALLTIVTTISMLVITQARVAPRRTIVHSMLWAANIGLLAYILYGLGLIPGAGWLQASLRIWGTALVVFVAMLLPLLWVQLRSE